MFPSCEVKIPQIIIGEDATVNIRLNNKKTKNPVDLTSATEIKAIFLNQDGTFLEKLLSTSGIVMISAIGGNFQINLTASETALLATSLNGGYSDIELNLTISGKLKIVNLTGAIEISPKAYPTA